MELATVLGPSKEAHSFSVKVVDNGSALLDHSRATLKRLEEWRGALEEWIVQDVRVLANDVDSERARLKQAAEAIADVAAGANFSESYNALLECVGELKEFQVPPWMNSVTPAEHSPGGTLVLFDFIDFEEIENLHKSLLEQRGKIDALAGQVRNSDIQLAADDHKVFQELARLFPRLEAAGQNDNQEILGDETCCRGLELARATLKHWIERVRTYISSGEKTLGKMSQGSLGLASLRDFCFQMREQAGSDGAPDAASVSLTMLQSQPFYSQIFDYVGVPQEQQLDFDFVNILETQVVAEFKGDLKDIAGMLDAIKKVGVAMLDAKQSYVNSVHDGVNQLVHASRAANQRALELHQQAESIMNDLEAGSSEFVKLKDIYKNYAVAARHAKGEVERRWKALAEMEELARKCQQEIDKLVEKEVVARTAFQGSYGSFLPVELCPALAPEVMPTSMLVLANSEDAQLLHDCAEKIESERNR